MRTGAAALGTLAVTSITQSNAADIYSGAAGYKDVPVASCCSFSGFYIGANAGMAWSEQKFNGGSFDTLLTATPFGGKTFDSTNGFAGGQFGYNFQNSCCWLYGIEADLGALGVNGRNHMSFTTPLSRAVAAVSFDGKDNNDAVFAGDITGRIGYTFGNSLVYVKGGFAFVDANTGINETIFWKIPVNSPNPSDTYGSAGGDNWLTGWTIGAGYEWKPCCQGNWSIKLEYLYYDFSNNNNSCCNDYYAQNFPGDNRFRNNNDLTVSTFKIGFNYFLNPAPVAVPLK
jgi:opacity protein-like surface antigen